MRITANAASFGADVRVVHAHAPEACVGLPDPDRVFVGGGGLEVLSHHRALWKAAHLLVVTTFDDVEQAVVDGHELTPTMRADLRVAATFATEASRRSSSGPTWPPGPPPSVTGSRLERAFRDMYTGTQHVFIGEKTYIDAAEPISDWSRTSSASDPGRVD